MSSQQGSQKLFQGLVSHELTVYLNVSDLFSTQQIMAILSEGCGPDNFESQTGQINNINYNFMIQRY